MTKEEKKLRYSSIDIDGVKYKTLLTDKFQNRKKYEEHNPAKSLAFIPGTIIEIFVKQKRKVKEGEVILILEAMKMNNNVMAPMDGVLKLYVKKQDVVSKNQLLFEIIV
ncbi:MAG: acetyl-CoA carboxylase biotin carboxyl carrier protein subunit [Bacteroidetes bacterium]|nr:acetyl-CoA carboxylase biotin carboxyl carrier protein subunit [Bacteroidota bacterium]MBL6943579.1 acetyl-CoA carboxylase biotin carboxyl carrier protein subunit [Bacteroidales bacterium]